MTETELKKKYNAFIQRHNKALKYLDNNQIDIDERENHIQAYKKILDELNSIIDELNKLGISYTDENILNGFEVN